MATSPDITYHMVQMGLCTFAELATGVIISCLPVIPKFFQHVYPRISASISNQARFPAHCRRRLSPEAVSTHKESTCGIHLRFWKKTSQLDHPETWSGARSHRAYFNMGDYTSGQLEIARSDTNAAHELYDLTLARPAKTRDNLVGRY